VEEKFKDVDSGDLDVIFAPTQSYDLETLSVNEDGGEARSMDRISGRPRSPRKRTLDEDLDILAPSEPLA